jgi:hypothetical protein
MLNIIKSSVTVATLIGKKNLNFYKIVKQNSKNRVWQYFGRRNYDGYFEDEEKVGKKYKKHKRYKPESI